MFASWRKAIRRYLVGSCLSTFRKFILQGQIARTGCTNRESDALTGFGAHPYKNSQRDGSGETLAGMLPEMLVCYVFPVVDALCAGICRDFGVLTFSGG